MTNRCRASRSFAVLRARRRSVGGCYGGGGGGSGGSANTKYSRNDFGRLGARANVAETNNSSSCRNRVE